MSEERRSGAWFSHRLTRAALVVSIPLALLGGMRAVGWTAAQLKVWNEGDTLTAADINGNFAALSTQVAALSTQLTAPAAPLGWTNLSLVNAWAAYGDGYAPPSCAKDALGIVHLRGLVKGSTGSQVTMATLPVGFRPKYTFEALVPCGGSAPCTVVIKTTGEMVFEEVYPNSNSSWLSFDSLTFDTTGG